MPKAEGKIKNGVNLRYSRYCISFRCQKWYENISIYATNEFN